MSSFIILYFITAHALEYNLVSSHILKTLNCPYIQKKKKILIVLLYNNAMDKQEFTLLLKLMK